MSTAEEHQGAKSPKEDQPAQVKQEQQDGQPQDEDVEMGDANDGALEQVAAAAAAQPETATTPVPVVDYAAESRKIEEKAKMYLARQTKAVIMPSFAAWFSMDGVHEIEKRSLPEFFNNNSRFKTDKIYMDIRNFMINAFRLNPTEYLTVTAARRNIAADVASIIRIHAFLEQWGLINYQIDPKTKPSLVGPQYTGHFQIILDTPEGLKPFVPEGAKIIKGTSFTTTTETAENEAEQAEIKLEEPLNLQLRKNIFDSTHDAIAFNEADRVTSANNKVFTCSVTGNDSTDVRYHSLKSKNSISARAYKEGHFPSNLTSADFVRLEKLDKANDSTKWTDQETLLLLEGIEMFEDDWNKISSHVATKTNEQCITKFIQLPIEDKYFIKSLGDVKTQSNTEQNDTNESVIKTIKFLIKNLDGADSLDLQNDADIQRAMKLTLGSILGGAHAEQQSLQQQSTKLVESLVDLEITKIEHKLSKLSILEKQLHQERAELVQQRKDVILDRLTLKKQTIEVRNALLAATSAPTPQEGAVLANAAVKIANRAPRVAVIVSKQSEENEVDEDAKDKEAVEKAIEVAPVSAAAPEAFQYWSL